MQRNPLTKSLPQQYAFIQRVCLRPAGHVLPLFSPHPSRLFLNASEMSVTFTRYMWVAVAGCSLLSYYNVISGWELCDKGPLSQALRVSWVRLVWNSSVPDGRIQRPRGRHEANDETWFTPLPLYTSTVPYQWQSQGALLKSLRIHFLKNHITSTQNILKMLLFCLEIH